MSPGKVADVPPTFPGFERVNRYYEVSTEQRVAQILPGDFYVTRNDEIVSTVLLIPSPLVGDHEARQGEGAAVPLQSGSRPHIERCAPFLSGALPSA